MPTRTGVRSLVVAGILFVFARIFAVPEADAIAVAIIAAVLLSLVSLYLRPLRLSAHRWVEPETIHVGDRAQILLEVSHHARRRSPPVLWTGSIWIPSLRRNESKVITEPLDTTHRGSLTLPPGEILRSDALGLCTRTRTLMPAAELMVLPRIATVPMPVAGAGILGELLMRNAQRLGLGEFDGLREYVDGDDPRAIHWRASARSAELMVRQFTVEGARRCTVILDRDSVAAASAGTTAFEVAVEISATLVVAAEASGLATRLVISAGADLSGTSISSAAITALTLVQPGPAINNLDRDGSEGLGILIVVSTARIFPAARVRALAGDAALVPIRVLTSTPSDHQQHEEQQETGSTVSTDPAIYATDLESFTRQWQGLVGGRS